MRSRAVRVPKPRAEGVRRRLRDSDWLRTDLLVDSDPEHVFFPLIDAATPAVEDGEMVDHEFAPLVSRPASYRAMLDGFTPEELDQLPRAFDVVGDLVLIRIPAALAERADEVGAALLRFVPGARKVGWDLGVHGVERRRELRCIAGSGPWSTVHRENGLELEVDPSVAYFSPRLAHEHARVAAQVRPGERVFDVCAGVGPFGLLIAREVPTATVVSLDINPDAIRLLRRNAERLGVADRVRPVEGDLASSLPSLGVADRAVFNLPHEGIKYLTSVGTSVGPTGALHYYELTDRSKFEARGDELVTRCLSPAPWRVADRRVVHPYSPESDLVAFTFERGPE